ncbi:hypothetical protein [Desulforamulus ferrireducens]|uniref:Uncharacterized protein n=1 Tax=Desulforamulus ferrireducens TaxID=1833852 RepID=A0A1S6IUB3_9FIRM|nr:hypothetical protein [Desulforamulus ferrireducens]AQS58368.1 hypothetical protein B0537_04225 [Desulforamulus ferrireducens]
MGNSFIKEIMRINRVMLTSVIILILAACWYYQANWETWVKSLSMIGIIIIVMLTKKWRIKRMEKELDERLQSITYYALSIGFYSVFLVIFWFYIKELIIDGNVSVRTMAEIFAGLAGYLISYIYLKRKY